MKKVKRKQYYTAEQQRSRRLYINARKIRELYGEEAASKYREQNNHGGYLLQVRNFLYNNGYTSTR